MSEIDDKLDEILDDFFPMETWVSIDDYMTPVKYDRWAEIAEANKKIKALLQEEILELVGNDTGTRSTTQNPSNPRYWTRRTKFRNELRDELRQAINDKLGE